MEKGITCILLAASHAHRLTLDIELDYSGCYSSLQGVPKTLLPGPHGIKILDHWWNTVRKCSEISQILLVSNADKYKHFERWAGAAGFPLECIIIDGSTMASDSPGAVADLELAVRTRGLQSDDVLVIAGDMMYQDGQFELSNLLEFWSSHSDADVAVYYNMPESEQTTTRGILELVEADQRVTGFLEKPLPCATPSRLASVVLYGLRGSTLRLLPALTRGRVWAPQPLGAFMEVLVNEHQRPVYGYNVAAGFQLMSDVSLSQYLAWFSFYSSLAQTVVSRPRRRGYTARAYSRVGLVGNTSDGFYGKTITMTVSNFWAEVTIATLRLLPHPLNDPTEFGSLNDLHSVSSREGYLGGLRLLQATCKMFHHYCTQRSISLSAPNFTLSYSTNIPRQVGLAGSSAIVTAALHALCAHHGVTEEQMPRHLRPQLVLDVETQELCINAGLQDRVVQVYEGLVYMDFSRSLIESDGHGLYKRLPLSCGVPRLYLAYRTDSSDSGRIHSGVRERWNRGDPEVVADMAELASITDAAMPAIATSDWDTLGTLMQRNFDVRLRLYGDACLGAQNLRMVAIAREHGSSAKFPGSGGAVLGLVTNETDMEGLRAQYQAEGCVVVDVIPYLPETESGTLLTP